MEASEMDEGQVAPESQEPNEEQPKPEGEVAKPETPEVPEPKKEARGVAKRLQELTRQRDEWKELALKQQEKPAEPEEPLKSLKDFNYDEVAHAQYLFDRAEKRAAAKAESVARESMTTWQKEQSKAQAERQFRAREAEFARTVDDYADIAYSAPISNDVAEIVKAMDDGPRVAYYLGKPENAEIAESISQLNPRVAAVELGRIAARLSSEKPKPVSEAPAPPPKLEPSDPGNVERDPSKMSDAEFSKWFRKIRKR